MRARETGQLAEEPVGTGVSDHVTRVDHVQSRKVVMQRVTHHHFSLQDGKNLQEIQGAALSSPLARKQL